MPSRLLLLHPAGSEISIDFPTDDGATRAAAALDAAEWTPDPVCPCCSVKVATVDGIDIMQSAIEEVAVDEGLSRKCD